MADDYGSTERWTLRSLVGAFLDLAIAYIFLCAAAVAFAATKFFSFFGVSLSCQHCPPFALRHAPAVCPPFALRPAPAVCPRCPGAPSGRSSPVSSSRRAVILYNNCTVKRADGGEEKPVVVLRHRRCRHQRSSLASSSRADLSESSESTSPSPSPAPPPPLRLGWKREETPIPISYPEQFDSSVDEQEIGDQCVGLENDACDLTIEELRRAINEERAARAKLSRELEEERSAAASAADEAVAMMMRLQKEKAAVEIEARQYRRMAEEKSTYDGEELETLKEIIVRREREKYVLEMELEEYQQIMMNNTGSGGGGGCEQSQDASQLTRKPSAAVVDSPDPVAIPHGIYDSVDKSSGMDTEMLSSRSPPEDYSQECRSRDISSHSFDQDDGATDKEVAGIDGHVYDVHVIDDDKMSLDDDDDQDVVKHLEPSHAKSGSSEALTVDQSSDISVIRPTEMEDLRGSSLSVIDMEKLVLEKEVALLRKRLEAIQQGREKLRFPLDQTEEESLRLQILKEISYQLEEINKSTEAGEAILHISKIS